MYKKMIEDAQAKGLGSEKTMWKGVEDIDEMLCVMKKEHPDMYWKFIRKQHGLLYNGHYTEDFAMWDVEQMKPLGMYWSPKQIEEATKGMSFPSEVNLWDKFVAFNASVNDLSPLFSDEQIIKAAHKFWFADIDFKNGKSATKIWDYMCMVHTK